MTFIDLLKAKIAGRPYDVGRYVRTLDDIIRKVYAERYQAKGLSVVALPKDVIWPGLEREGVKGPGAKSKEPMRISAQELGKGKHTQRIDYRLGDGTALVDFESFRNRCWEHVEEPRFLNKAVVLYSAKDRSLLRALKTTFENLLRE